MVLRITRTSYTRSECSRKKEGGVKGVLSRVTDIVSILNATEVLKFLECNDESYHVNFRLDGKDDNPLSFRSVFCLWRDVVTPFFCCRCD